MHYSSVQILFNFIHHVAIKNNDKHKKLKAKYINFTKLNYSVQISKINENVLQHETFPTTASNI